MVWNRTHVEVLAPDAGDWAPLGPELPAGAEHRILSIDEGDGAVTAELRLPADWRFDEHWSIGSDVDLYLLDGQLRVGEVELVRNDFSHRPAGFVNGPVRVQADTRILAFVQGRPRLQLHPARAATEPLDRAHRGVVPRLPALSVPARPPLTDRETKPNIFSRTLRMDPVTGERIFITGSRPDSTRTQRGDPRIEWHECVEEIYALDGWVSMDHPDDRLKLAAGWYCFRPPGIPHGPFQNGPAVELATLFRVSSTLTNNYVDIDEAKRLWRDYPETALFPTVRERIGRPSEPFRPGPACGG